MDRQVARVILLDCLKESRAVAPRPPLLRAAVVLVLQDHRQLRPECLGEASVIPLPRRRLHHDAVVAERHALRERIVGERKPISCRVVPDDVVADAEKRARKVLGVQVDVPADELVGPVLGHPTAHVRMPLAPEPKAADVDEGDVGIAVVAGCHRRQEPAELFKKDRVAEVGIPAWALVHGPVAELVKRPIRSGVFHPLGRRPGKPVLGAGDAKRHLLPLGDPPLRRRVEERPVEPPLLGLNHRPRDPQVDGGDAGEPFGSVAGGEVRPVVVRHVRVVMHCPAHAGIDERCSRVGRPRHGDAVHPLLHARARGPCNRHGPHQRRDK